MNRVLADDRARWFAAAAAATVATALLVAMFGRPQPPTTPVLPRTAAVPTIQMARPTAENALLREEAELRDLRPLFLPTEFSVSLSEPRRQTGKAFQDNDGPKLGVVESEWSLTKELPPVATVNGKPADEATPLDAVARTEAELRLTGFGRNNSAVPERRRHGGSLEVVDVASGHVVLSDVFPAEVRPPGDKPWEPLEFLATVNAAGLAAPLVVTASSRVEEVDAHVRNFLARQYRIGHRLPPGFYRIVVAP